MDNQPESSCLQSKAGGGSLKESNNETVRVIRVYSRVERNKRHSKQGNSSTVRTAVPTHLSAPEDDGVAQKRNTTVSGTLENQVSEICSTVEKKGEDSDGISTQIQKAKTTLKTLMTQQKTIQDQLHHCKRVLVTYQSEKKRHRGPTLKDMITDMVGKEENSQSTQLEGQSTMQSAPGDGKDGINHVPLNEAATVNENMMEKPDAAQHLNSENTEPPNEDGSDEFSLTEINASQELEKISKQIKIHLFRPGECPPLRPNQLLLVVKPTNPDNKDVGTNEPPLGGEGAHSSSKSGIRRNVLQNRPVNEKLSTTKPSTTSQQYKSSGNSKSVLPVSSNGKDPKTFQVPIRSDDMVQNKTGNVVVNPKPIAGTRVVPTKGTKMIRKKVVGSAVSIDLSKPAPPLNRGCVNSLPPARVYKKVANIPIDIEKDTASPLTEYKTADNIPIATDEPKNEPVRPSLRIKEKSSPITINHRDPKMRKVVIFDVDGGEGNQAPKRLVQVDPAHVPQMVKQLVASKTTEGLKKSSTETRSRSESGKQESSVPISTDSDEVVVSTECLTNNLEFVDIRFPFNHRFMRTTSHEELIQAVEESIQIYCDKRRGYFRRWLGKSYYIAEDDEQCPCDRTYLTYLSSAVIYAVRSGIVSAYCSANDYEDEENEEPSPGDKLFAIRLMGVVKKCSLKQLVSHDFDLIIDWDRISARVHHVLKAEDCQQLWDLLLRPTIRIHPWPHSLTKKLMLESQKIGVHKWDLIAKSLGRRHTPYHTFCHFSQNLYVNEKTGRWTKEEETRLNEIVLYSTYSNIINWKKVVAYFDSRTKRQVQHKWYGGMEPNVRKGRFTLEEDKKIVIAARQGYDFDNVPLLSRTRNQIRQHLTSIGDRFKKKFGEWSLSEDQQLLKLVEYHGEAHWAEVAAEMPKRSRTQIRQRYSVLKKVIHEPGFQLSSLKRHKRRVPNQGLLNTSRLIKELNCKKSKAAKKRKARKAASSSTETR